MRDIRTPRTDSRTPSRPGRVRTNPMTTTRIRQIITDHYAFGYARDFRYAKQEGIPTEW